MTVPEPHSSASVWGVFGGSFNPPHIAHVLACHFALAAWNLQKVIVIPSYKHPFGKPLEEFEHRLAMCRLAFEHLGQNVDISSIEQERGGVSYTVDSLRVLTRDNPGVQFRLLVGGDILAEAQKWHAFEEVKTLAPLLIIPRLQDGRLLGGDDPGDCFLPDISSSQLRANLAAGQDAGVALPAKVSAYIQEHRLYRASSTSDAY